MAPRNQGRGAGLRWLLCGILLGAGCGREPPREGASQAARRDEYTVLSWNLDGYGLRPEYGSGPQGALKPPAARTAIIEVLRALNADIVLLQEIEAGTAWEQLTADLRAAGLTYATQVHVPSRSAVGGLALLSRFGLVRHQAFTNETYSMGGETVPMAHAFLEADLQLAPNYLLRVINAQLRGRVFHPLNQTDMRRNEGRLLNNKVRAALNDYPERNLLVAGSLADNPHSSSVREVAARRGRLLEDLRPQDGDGAAWTVYQAEDDSYARHDYLLASRGLVPEVVTNKTRIPYHPALATASRHRPLLLVGKKQNLAPPIALPDLEALESDPDDDES
ncbi:MAG: endonuclease/exonuclease/phosphatase family protein [Candidatus Marinimicrobia bacterium]|nr:endonuclease/exonuclease/phosphatase family protein [Candidatus Neomarinimicrobiota bacterium]